MERLTRGNRIPTLHLRDIYQQPVSIPDNNKIIHMQFRRLAGCPICTVHMSRLRGGKERLEQAGVKEIIIFYSEDKDIKNLLGDIPFTLVADPKRALYRRFGVTSSWRSVMDPRAWPAAMKGLLLNLGRALQMLPKGEESMFGLPADFLIDTSGLVLAAHYGTHAYDQWDIDDIVTLASSCAANLMPTLEEKPL